MSGEKCGATFYVLGFEQKCVRVDCNGEHAYDGPLWRDYSAEAAAIRARRPPERTPREAT